MSKFYFIIDIFFKKTYLNLESFMSFLRMMLLEDVLWFR